MRCTSIHKSIRQSNIYFWQLKLSSECQFNFVNEFKFSPLAILSLIRFTCRWFNDNFKWNAKIWNFYLRLKITYHDIREMHNNHVNKLILNRMMFYLNHFEEKRKQYIFLQFLLNPIYSKSICLNRFVISYVSRMAEQNGFKYAFKKRKCLD